MFAYVKFVDLEYSESKKKVFVEDIKHFDPDSFDKRQFYKVKQGCAFLDAQIICVADTENQLDKLVSEKTCSATDEYSKISADKVIARQFSEMEMKEKIGSRRRYEEIPIYEERDPGMKKTRTLYESVDAGIEILHQPDVSSTSSRTSDTLVEGIARHDKETSNLKRQLNIIAEDLEKTQHQLYLKSRKLNDKDKTLRDQELKIKFYREQLNEKEKELVEIRQLNRQLQQNTISNIYQLNSPASLQKAGDESVESVERSPSVGDLRKSDDMVYIGRGKWLPAMTYAMVTNSVKRSSPGKFVKNMTSVMFSRDILLKSTVSGQKSNRDKRNNPVDKLDPLTIQAIKDIFRFWLTKTMRYPPEIVESEVDKTKNYISKKIADLKRARNEERVLNVKQFYSGDRKQEASAESEDCDSGAYFYQQVNQYPAHVKMEEGHGYETMTSDESVNVSGYGQDLDENEYQKVYVMNEGTENESEYKDEDLVQVLPV